MDSACAGAFAKRRSARWWKKGEASSLQIQGKDLKKLTDHLDWTPRDRLRVLRNWTPAQCVSPGV